jgi:organic hydroperoxide reductase OsmC/OhrA
MNSFLSLAESSEVAIASYHCQCFIKLEKDNHKFSPMEILVRPSVKLINERDKPKAYNLMEKAEADCSIKKMININIKVLPQIDSL